MFLRTPAAGSIGFGMTLFFMVGFTMLIKDWGAQLLSVLVLVQSVLLLDGLPSMAMSPICPCYLPIAGTVVGRRQGMSTHRWALPLGPTVAREIPYSLAWDLTVPSYRVWPRGGTAGVLAVERLCTGRRRLTHSAPLFTLHEEG
ncbi:hypothetical protein KUCAC02_010968 [Chaenocephalus aceratus]|uniref:Uncharacterized protein n=1 Tax=Chaenocephalus aceratus TaxID=36190 RepID=A0ACB9WVZ0_CHAAC|nr:hypothetical protein KUCAC02_010968 [Chaenocephalus aceratus]